MVRPSQNFQRYIFMADDDEDDRYLFADALREVDSSITLKQVENGIHLMQILNELSDIMPEVLFLDINMPGKSGLDCLQEIRRKEGSLKKMNIIILSTSNNPINIEMALKLGANFYVVKPNRFEEIKLLIQTVLNMDWDDLKNDREFRLL